MSRLKDEIQTQDISDIEEGVIENRCNNCREKQYRCVKVVWTTDNCGQQCPIKTKNVTGVCLNPKCFRYTDLTQTPSWVLESQVK